MNYIFFIHLGVFIFLVMTFNCISLITATIVMNIKKRGNTRHIPDVPPWVLRFCEKTLAKIVCTKMSYWNIQFNLCEEENNENETDLQKCIPSQRRKSSTAGRFRSRLSESDIFHVRKENTELNLGYDSSDSESETGSLSDEGSSIFNNETKSNLLETPNSSRFNLRRSYKRILRNRPSYRKAVNRETLIDCLYEQCTGQDAEELQEEVKFSHPDKTIHEVTELKRKWYFVAECVDKAAFLVYLISMLFTVVTVLLIIPSFS